MTLPPPPITREAAQPVASRQAWSVGTLTYTTAGLVVLFCWLLWGDFALSMKDRAIPPTMQLLLKDFGASDTFTGVVFGSLSSILNMVISPMISYKSDRHRGRWGRRIPFLLGSTPFMVVGMIGLGCSPMLGTFLHQRLGFQFFDLNTSVLMSFLVFYLVFELACTVSSGLYGALVNDVVPEPLLGRFYGLFRAVSLIAGIFFYHFIFGKAETAYLWIFLGMAALYGIGFTLTCLKVKEGRYPEHVPMDRGRSIHGTVAIVGTYFRECFGKSYYLWYFAAVTISGMAGIPFNLFSVFYSKSVGMTPEAYGNCLALTYMISLGLAYPIGWLADRVHPLRLCLVTGILYSGALLAAYFLVTDTRTFGIALVALGVIAGTGGTAGASLGQRLLPRGEFAQFSSAAGLLSSVSWIVLPSVVGIFLDHAQHEYRYTFLMGSCLGFMGFAAMLVLHARFVALGGPAKYVAPE